VGGVLILAGSPQHLDRVKFVHGIYYVDSLDEWIRQRRTRTFSVSIRYQ
jgi:hypothetical protein